MRSVFEFDKNLKISNINALPPQQYQSINLWKIRQSSFVPMPQKQYSLAEEKAVLGSSFQLSAFLLTATRDLLHTRLTLPFSNCNLLWPDFSLCSNQTIFHIIALWTNQQNLLNLKSFTMAGWATSAPTMLLSCAVGTS